MTGVQVAIMLDADNDGDRDALFGHPDLYDDTAAPPWWQHERPIYRGLSLDLEQEDLVDDDCYDCALDPGPHCQHPEQRKHYSFRGVRHHHYDDDLERALDVMLSTSPPTSLARQPMMPSWSV